MLFDLDVFEYGFNDQIHILEGVGVFGDGRQAVHDGVHGLLEALLFGHAVEDLADEGFAGFQGFGNVLDQDGNLRVSDNINGNAAAHGAEAEDGYFVERFRLEPLGHHGLGLVGHALDEKRVDAPLGLGGQNHLGKIVDFLFQALFEGDLDPFMDGFERQKGAGDIAALGRLENALAGHFRNGVDFREIMGRAFQTGSAGVDLQHQFFRFSQQIAVRRDQTIHDAGLIRLGRGHHSSLQDHLKGGIADQPRQALRAAAAREKAHVAFGQADQRAFAFPGDPGRTSQGKFEAAAQAVAVDGRDGRKIEGVELREGTVEKIQHVARLFRLFNFRDHFQIGAGKKVVGFAGNKDEALDPVCFSQFIDQLVETQKGLVRPGVHGVARNIECDDSDAAVFRFQIKDLSHCTPPQFC